MPSTSSPADTTTPDSSDEGIAGRRSTGHSSSSRVSAAACTRTSASSARGCGVGMRSTFRPSTPVGSRRRSTVVVSGIAIACPPKCKLASWPRQPAPPLLSADGARAASARRPSTEAARGARALELAPHRDGVAAVLVDADEAVLLVEREQGVVASLDTEAQRRVALGLRALAEGVEKRFADPAAAATRNDGDRELGRLLVDEAVSRVVATEKAVPRGADRKAVLDRDQDGVARPPPTLDIAGDRARLLAGAALAPVVGVVEHVAEEADILPASAANDHRPLTHSASAGSSSRSFSVWRNSAAGAPSTARWSNVPTNVVIGRTASSPSTGTTRSSIAPTATIAACGGLCRGGKLGARRMSQDGETT